MSRRSDRSGDQLLLGPRHGAEDGAGRRAYEAYADLDPVGTPPPSRRFIDYPRRSRRGWTRWIPSWRLVLTLSLVSVAAVCTAVLAKYFATVLPDAQNADATFQTTVVKDSSGREIGRFSAQTRFWKPLSQISPTMQNAVLAAEDRTFRTNQGVSFTAVVRAALNNVRGGQRQGGSTITQQYVKNAFSSTTDRSVGRKVDEFFVSIKAAQELSKDDILENYLNIIYFGRGCYGIEAAAQCYFGPGKTAKNLTPSEAAYLAGIINGPELYDSGTPAAVAAAKARWTYVLNGMVTEGWLTQAERDRAVFPKIRPRTTTTKAAADDQTPYLMQMVQQEAKDKYKLTEQDLQRGGFVITTTFDPAKVNAAKASVREVLGPRRTWPKGTQAALVTVDATNGQVVSVYAGDGKRSRNAVTQDIVQAGSTFKPFGLVAALEGKRPPGNCDAQAPDDDSVSLRSRFDGRSPQRFPDLKKPVTNFGGQSFGKIDLIEATASSVNTVYAALNRKVGPEHTRQVALCAGYSEGTVDLDATALNVLGPSSPNPIDVARSFATFAAQGVQHDTFVIKGISRTDGEVVVPQVKPEGRRVFDEGVMADATYAMQAVVEEGSATAVRRLGRPAAGKTGTSSLNKSAWFAGFTPRYATVVALYRIGEDGSQQRLIPWGGIGNEVVGGGYPARVWTSYMSRVLEGTPVEKFPTPVYGGETIDPSPSPSPSPSASAPTPTPSASVSEPEESPSPSLPSPSASSPSPTVSPSPSPSDPEPTPPVTPTPSPPNPPKPSPTE